MIGFLIPSVNIGDFSNKRQLCKGVAMCQNNVKYKLP
jgi:hypothetical protein